jgi:predicted nucleic-acid-binding protein
MEKPYELIMDNNYMYSVIEKMLDDQSIFIDLQDNIPE